MKLTRRGSVGLLAAASAASWPGGAANAAVPASVAAGAPSLRGPTVDLMTPQGNVRAVARLQGNVDMKSDKYTWYDGWVSAVVPGRAVFNLFGFRGMAASRLVPLESEPGYRLLNREFGVYYDLATREVLDTFRNPLSDETVRVVHLANDPVNHTIREWMSPPPVERAAAAMTQTKRPLQYAWRVQDDRLLMARYVHLFYPNALDPAVWTRESSGPMVQASEYTSWNMSLSDMQNERITSLDAVGNWTRVTPWLPWMLMGTAAGHCLYETTICKVTRYEQIPADIRSVAEQRFALYTRSPEKYVDGSGSSLENYAKQNRPAPPRSTR
jgi:hypothetical protein